MEITFAANGTATKTEKTQLGDVTHIREETLTSATERYEYSHRDHLGSVEVITDEAGNPVFNLAFDPFGGYRTLDWPSSGGNPTPLAQLLHTARGFTGHEQLDDVGLIHMNGRVYDPTLGRFMSADPIVQAPTYSQSYNRYAYVWNNPLGMTDPTGYQACWECYYSMRTTEALEGGAMMSELGPLMWAGAMAASQSSSSISAPVIYREGGSGRFVTNAERASFPEYFVNYLDPPAGNVTLEDCVGGCPKGSVGGDSNEQLPDQQVISGTATFSSIGEVSAVYQRLDLNLRAYSLDKKQWTNFKVTAQGAVSGAELIGPVPVSGTTWNVLLIGPYVGINKGPLTNYFDGAVVNYSSFAFSPGVGLSYGSLSVGDFNHSFSIDSVYGFGIGWSGFRGSAVVDSDSFSPGFVFP